MKKKLVNTENIENFKTRFWYKVEQYTTQSKKRRLFSSLKYTRLYLVFLNFTYKYRVVYSKKVFNITDLSDDHSQKDFLKNSCNLYIIFYNNCVLKLVKRLNFLLYMWHLPQSKILVYFAQGTLCKVVFYIFL